MEVSVKSWHYRYINFWHPSYNAWKPKSLCAYFWTLVLHLIFGVAVLGGIGVALLGLALSAKWMWDNPNYGLGIITLLGVITVIIIFLFRAENKHQEKLASGWTPPVKVKKPDNIVWAFIKAKKRKVCPLIEYTK